MASSHNLRKPNTGEGELSVQEKSMSIHMPGDKTPVEFSTTPEETGNNPHVISERNHVSPLIQPQQIKFPVVNSSDIQYTNSLKYDFDDIVIVPKDQSNIRSRYTDINPFYNNELGNSRLPIFTAPMDSVVNHDNAHIFQSNKINVVLPRTENTKGILYATFTSYGLKDNPQLSEHVKFVLLDVANGHMSLVIQWCVNLKKKYPHIKIMAGNIANPQTYQIYCASGVIDYARVGIGNGNGCLTTQQTGVGFPMASLIRECYEIKKDYIRGAYVGGKIVQIVADGGMKKPSDIIKALALGADYVMVGSLFSKALESAAPLYWKGIRLNSLIGNKMLKMGFNVKKQFRGMSTKGAQKALGNKTLKTSEGVTRYYDIEYTLPQLVENIESYLRSTMSYCNANSLGNFIGKADIALVSQNAFNRFTK